MELNDLPEVVEVVAFAAVASYTASEEQKASIYFSPGEDKQEHEIVSGVMESYEVDHSTAGMVYREVRRVLFDRGDELVRCWRVAKAHRPKSKLKRLVVRKPPVEHYVPQGNVTPHVPMEQSGA